MTTPAVPLSQTAFDAYWKDRYEAELSWYEKKSARNKRGYVVLRIASIALAASIPVFVNFTPWPALLGSLLGALIVIAEGVSSVFQFHENWINYRSTAETLKKEGEFYKAKLGEYATVDDARRFFIERIEALVSREHTFWRATAKKSTAAPRQ